MKPSDSRRQWLQGIAALLPVEYREQFTLRVASLASLDENDPLFQMLDVLGFVTLALDKSAAGVVALSESMDATRLEIKNLSGGIASQVTAFNEGIAKMQEEAGKSLASEVHRIAERMKQDLGSGLAATVGGNGSSFLSYLLPGGHVRLKRRTLYAFSYAIMIAVSLAAFSWSGWLDWRAAIRWFVRR